MVDTPNVSVIMAVHNGEQYLTEAIESILQQSLTSFELIIVNDGSADGTGQILSRFKRRDKRIRILTNDDNIGLPDSLNRAIALSTGAFIARLDADDVALPERLKMQADFLSNHPDCVIVGSGSYRIDCKGKLIETHLMPQTNSEIRVRCLFENPFIHPSVMMRGDIFREQGLSYRSDFQTTQDWALWVDILKHGEAANIPVPLIKQRIHQGSISSRKSEVQLQNSLRVQRAYCEHYVGADFWSEDFFMRVNLVFLKGRSDPTSQFAPRAKICLEVLGFSRKVEKQLAYTEALLLREFVVYRSVLVGMMSPPGLAWLRLAVSLGITGPLYVFRALQKIMKNRRARSDLID